MTDEPYRASKLRRQKVAYARESLGLTDWEIEELLDRLKESERATHVLRAISHIEYAQETIEGDDTDPFLVFEASRNNLMRELNSHVADLAMEVQKEVAEVSDE